MVAGGGKWSSRREAVSGQRLAVGGRGVSIQQLVVVSLEDMGGGEFSSVHQTFRLTVRLSNRLSDRPPPRAKMHRFGGSFMTIIGLRNVT